MTLQTADVPENVVAIVAIMTVFVIFPLVIMLVRYLWKRADLETPTRRDMSDAMGMRLAQMQTSIDAMAVEIERISEGQRFVTKVLTERERAPAQLPGRDRAPS